MTPDEIALFRIVGEKYLYRDLATPLIASLAYGIGLPLIYYVNSTLRSRKTNGRPAAILYWLTFISFIFMNIHFTTELAKISLDFDIGGTMKNTKTLAALAASLTSYDDQNWKVILVRNWTDSIGLIISDAVVIWRVCVLLPSRRTWAIIVPSFILSASAVLSIVSCVFGSTVKGSQVGTSPTRILFNTLTGAAYCCSLAANILATGVFAFHLRRLQSMRTKAGHAPNSRSHVQRTLFFLIESGVLFCISQIASITVLYCSVEGRIKTLAQGLAFDVVVRFQYALSILYPILVVALVRTKNSVVDTHKLESTAEQQTSQTIAEVQTSLRLTIGCTQSQLDMTPRVQP